MFLAMWLQPVMFLQRLMSQQLDMWQQHLMHQPWDMLHQERVVQLTVVQVVIDVALLITAMGQVVAMTMITIVQCGIINHIHKEYPQYVTYCGYLEN